MQDPNNPAAASSASTTHPTDSNATPPPPAPPGIWRGWVRPLLTVLLIVTALRSSLVDWNDVPTGSMKPTIMPGDRIVVSKLSYALNPPFNGPTIPLPFVDPRKHPRNPLDFLPGFYYGKPQRNDIVTFWKPAIDIDGEPIDDGGIRMVKRIVAVPGDTIEMRPQTITLENGRPYQLSKLVLNGEVADYAFIGSGPNLQVIEQVGGIQRHVQYRRNSTVIHPQTQQPVRFPVHPRAVSFGPVTLGEDEYLMIGDNRDNSQDGRFFGPVQLTQITGEAKFIAVAFDGSYTRPNWSRFFQGLE